MPVKPLQARVRVTQHFGNYWPQMYGGDGRHKGIDLSAWNRQPVYYPESGFILEVYENPWAGFGYGVRLRGESGLHWIMGHFADRVTVHPNDAVSGGAQAGWADNTGASTGNHLHLEVRDHDVPINPLHVYADGYAKAAGIDMEIFHRQMEMESGWNCWARSSAGALGVAQIIPKWHPTVDPWDPFDALKYAANLDAAHLEWANGNYRRALAAYNAGRGRIKVGGVWVPERLWPRETQMYVNGILGEADMASVEELEALRKDAQRNHELKMEALAELGPAIQALNRAQINPGDEAIRARANQWWHDNVVEPQ